MGAVQRAAPDVERAGHPLRNALVEVRHALRRRPGAIATARPNPTAQFAIAHAEAGFTANVPLSFLEQESALLATHGDGEVLEPDHGYPLRLVIPGKYFWKSAKWLRGIELSSIDKPGFWERYGYHNDADPWREERYGF